MTPPAPLGDGAPRTTLVAFFPPDGPPELRAIPPTARAREKLVGAAKDRLTRSSIPGKHGQPSGLEIFYNADETRSPVNPHRIAETERRFGPFFVARFVFETGEVHGLTEPEAQAVIAGPTARYAPSRPRAAAKAPGRARARP